MSDAPSFIPPVVKLSFTLIRFPKSMIQPVIDFITEMTIAFGAEIIINQEEVKDEPLPESIHIS